MKNELVVLSLNPRRAQLRRRRREEACGVGGRLGGYKRALDYLALSAPAFSTPIKGVLFGYQDSSDSNF